MRVSQVEYAVLLSQGYDNYRCAVTVDLEPGDSEVEALRRAKEFVNRQVRRDTVPEYEIEEARKVLAAARQCSPEKIERAHDILTKIDGDELPF